MLPRLKLAIERVPKHHQQTSQTTPTVLLARPSRRDEGERAHLNDSANLDGLTARNGRVMNDTKKHTAAPNKHPPKPSSLSSPTSSSRPTGHITRASLTDPTAKARHTPPPHSTARSSATAHIPLPPHCKTSQTGSPLLPRRRPGLGSRCCSRVPSGIGRGSCGRTVRSRGPQAWLLPGFFGVGGIVWRGWRGGVCSSGRG